MLTNFNNFTIALHETAFFTLIEAFREQVPRIFNYATADLIAAIDEDVDRDPKGVGTLICDKEVIERNNKRRRPLREQDLFTPVSYLPIPGYDGDRGISYIVQIGRITFDFHPNETIRMPRELSDQFVEQSVGLELGICMGIACPVKETLEKILEAMPPPQPDDPKKDDPKKDDPTKDPPEPPDGPANPFPVNNIDCFCLTVKAVGRFKRRPQTIDTGGEDSVYLSLELSAVEIVDIEPRGLENSLECLIYMILTFGVLPKLRMLISDLKLAVGPFSVVLEPLSDKIPFNPAVERDRLLTFLRLQVAQND